MPRRNRTPGVKAYYRTLQKIFKLQSEILTAVLPHKGERGRNDEERFRDFLQKTLPRRFSVGTGFVVCSDPRVPRSGQTDVVIFDELFNSPLHRELAAFVYPVEMVYAAIEVKGLLSSKDLKKSVADIARLRRLAERGRYVLHGSVPVSPAQPTKRVGAMLEVPRQLAPRTYVFAFDAAGWKTIDSFASAWKRALSTVQRRHLHGVAVLNRNWFLYQLPYTDKRVELKTFSDNALLRFTNKLLTDISGMQMQQASLNRYLRLDPEPSNPGVQRMRGQRAARR